MNLVKSLELKYREHKRLRAFFKSPLAAPVLAVGAAFVAAPLTRWVDGRMHWSLLNFSAEGSRLILASLVPALLTFIVFVFTFLLLSVQVASGQLSPRIIARTFNNPEVRWSLGVFVFSFTYALGVLGRIDDHVPQLAVFVATMASLANLVLFVFLIERAGQALRPITVLVSVAVEARKVIKSTYPCLFNEGAAPATIRTAEGLGAPTATVRHIWRSGVLMSVDVAKLKTVANRCTIELVPQVGDFVPTGEPLFNVYGDVAPDETVLRASVRVGPERTLEQDPAFAFRIIVDIASKALSTAINDPTTAVLAIDQVQDLLYQIGIRELDQVEFQDSTGRVNLIYHTPNWDDYVCLAVTEIRLYGTRSPQVARRLRAMLTHLLRTLPAERAPAIEAQLRLLDRAVEQCYPDPDDRRMAMACDLQGLGGERAVHKQRI